MRVIKPLAASLTQRVFTWQRQPRMSIAVWHHFAFQAPELALPEIPMWTGLMEVLGDAAPDEGHPKTRGEVLLLGKGYAPKGAAVPVFAVGLGLWRDEAKKLIDKQVAVIGRRRWGQGGPSDPEPLTELPLEWSYAFGGEKEPRNPKGMGMDPDEDGVVWMPQLESPKALIRSPRERPLPAGFGPLDPTLTTRMAMMGTYDQKWLEQDFPGLARDLDPEFFQVAPVDQRIDGYFQGGELIEVTHAHPTEAKLRTRVPSLRARVFLRMRGDADDAPLKEVACRAETLILLPNIRRGVVVHRGVVDVVDDDGADVAMVVVALEHASSPKPASHYADAAARRLDPEKGHLHLVKEKDLLPERDPNTPSIPEESFGDMESIVEREGKLEERMRARAQTALDQARLQAEIAGLDPDDYFPAAPPGPPGKIALDDLSEYMEDLDAQVEDERARADKLKRIAEEQARHTFAILGMDYDAHVAEQQKKGGGPPAFKAAEELAKLQDIADLGRNADMPFTALEEQLAGDALRDKLEQMEAALLHTYRLTAHYNPGGIDVSDDQRRVLRARVEAAVMGEVSLAEVDLTGADLRGLDLRGLDLRDALLEGATLEDADLAGARLAGAVLVRANLQRANLGEADLSGANLGGVDARGATLARARLDRAILHGGDFEGADLTGVSLAKADLMEARLFGARLNEIAAPEAFFYDMDLTGADFSGARLHKALFCKCRLQGAVFDGAFLEEACFADSDATGGSFLRARLSKAKSVGKTLFVNADFSFAEAKMANFRGVSLRGAVLRGVMAESSDFSEADATGASFVGIRARSAAFMRTNLTDADMSRADLIEALMMRATLDRTNLEGANLFRANLLQARGHAPNLRGAFVRRVLSPNTTS